MVDIYEATIQLLSITDANDADGGKVKAITFRYESRVGNSLTATYVVGEHQVRDEALVSVARDWLHTTCKDIARATESWVMDEAQLKAADHPNKNPPTY